jgi:lysozyme-like protein
MPFPPVKLKPGPQALSAALYLAGFRDTVILPPVTEKAGVTWDQPSELQVILAVVGGESSGHSWVWNTNKNGSTDYGVLEINDKAHPEYFGPQKSPTQLSAWNYADNAKMAFAIYTSAKKVKGKSPFHPWNAYTNGGYLAVRYQGRSWMHWAQHGINSMWGAYAVLMKPGKLTSAQALAEIASTDKDPLRYW